MVNGILLQPTALRCTPLILNLEFPLALMHLQIQIDEPNTQDTQPVLSVLTQRRDKRQTT